ncbi:hypothetical protein [Paludibaculum fermentans]|uniref:hypothetical protein n=1 Tax=Paludibaculum fermentans TaxID=1473598 RepID=UPI003EBC5005
MHNINYAPVRRKSRDEILQTLSSGTAKDMAAALLSAAYWDPDWKWAEKQLVRFAAHDDPQVLWTVASGFGLLAAFHGEVDLDIVEPILAKLRLDTSAPGVADAAENSTDEIDHFVKRRRAGENVELGERMPEDWRPSS